MSAYIVDDETINSIIAGIEYSDALVRGTLGMSLDTHDEREQLGADMFRMNCDAVEQRYGQGQAKDFRDLDYKYLEIISPHPMQLLKSLDCYLYQCSEGNVPKTYMLYTRLDKFRNALMRDIIGKLPEYKKAKWA